MCWQLFSFSVHYLFTPFYTCLTSLLLPSNQQIFEGMKQEKSKPLSVQLAYEDYERLLQIEQEYLGRKEQQVKKRNLIKGLKGLQELFMCSTSTAWSIKNADWFRPALVQHGRHVLVDADIAWELANKYSRRCVYNRSRKDSDGEGGE